MLYIISAIIFVAGLLGMAVIFVGKFGQLANLDLKNLPEEKESVKKKEMIERRVVSERNRMLKSFLLKTEPVRKMWGRLQLRFRIYVGKIERLLHHEQRVEVQKELAEIPSEAVENKLQNLVRDGSANLEQGNFDNAEEMFIAAVKLDPKFAPAYRGLGDTYLAQGELEEAKETYLFLLQLEPNDDAVMVKISELFEKKGSYEEAINYLQQAVIINDSLSSRFYHLAELLLKVNQNEVAKEAIVQAVELEPKNPKFLDLLIEIGIQCCDKELSRKGFEELRLVNPENQKLESFQSRISSLV